jgi:predicted adenine nucleotide alpha hydrolase (AANH) superfamily ATPase
VAADHFRRQGDSVVGWFYNPNIQPPEEWERRAATMEEAARALGLSMLVPGGQMGTGDFLAVLGRQSGTRCSACYEMRLGATAGGAAEQGFEAFSTTLLMSPYQDLTEIARIGREAGARAGVEFRFEDLRSSYPGSCERSREIGLYRQNYCGCMFSAWERAERRARRALEKAAKVGVAGTGVRA